MSTFEISPSRNERFFNGQECVQKSEVEFVSINIVPSLISHDNKELVSI